MLLQLLLAHRMIYKRFNDGHEKETILTLSFALEISSFLLFCSPSYSISHYIPAYIFSPLPLQLFLLH